MDGSELLLKGRLVVWVLLSLSVLALAIVLERWIHFLRMGNLPRDLDAQLPVVLSKGTVNTLIEKLRGPEAAIMHALHNASQQGVTDLTRVAVRVRSYELHRERSLR